MTKYVGHTDNYPWHQDVTDIRHNSLGATTSSSITVNSGDKHLVLEYDDIENMLALVDALEQLDDDNELKRAFKAAMAVRRIKQGN